MAEMQYNTNNYNNEINVINDIMRHSNCGLPQNFQNKWAGGQCANDVDRGNMITWRKQLRDQLKQWKVNCNNIQVAFNMGQNLYNMHGYMEKINGPLANYYNACLWEVTKMFIDMMNDILINKKMLLKPNVQWRMNETNDPRTFTFQKMYQQQRLKWNLKYSSLTNARESSKMRFYDFDPMKDGFLWQVYGSKFINEKLTVLNQYKNQIDPFLR